MRHKKRTRVIETDLLSHPAVIAWRALSQDSIEPYSIEVLKDKKKSSVYRLMGVGPCSSAVIAKKRTRKRELTIYEDVLPYLPVSSIRCYGSLSGHTQDSSWLFLEDAGEDLLSPMIDEHRALAAQWLGLLHTSAAQIPAAARLPDKSWRYYMEVARSSRGMIVRNLDNPKLTADDLRVLNRLVSQLDKMESYCSKIERFCERMPITLIHGDFNQNNTRIRYSELQNLLLVFDWASAGWGIPARDIAKWPDTESRHPNVSCPDISVYWSVVSQAWPHLNIEDIQRMSDLGWIFRLLQHIYWEMEPFTKLSIYTDPLVNTEKITEWVKRIKDRMRCYESALADSVIKWFEDQ